MSKNNSILRVFNSLPNFDKSYFSTRAEMLTTLNAPNIKIRLNYRSMQKILELRDQCSIEIGILALVDQVQQQGNLLVYKVYDVFVPLQECSGTVTRILPEGRFDLFEKMAKEMGPKRAQEITQKMNFWWHYHPNMGTNPSPQDETQFKEGSQKRSIFFMSIGNTSGDLHCNAKIAIKVDSPEFENYRFEWDIRDIPWEYDWETHVTVKDELHPLLTNNNATQFSYKHYSVSSKVRLLRDPEIAQWAKEHIESMVKVIRGGRIRANYPKQSNQTVMVLGSPKEYVATDNIDIGKYVIQVFEDASAGLPELQEVESAPKSTVAKVEKTIPATTSDKSSVSTATSHQPPHVQVLENRQISAETDFWSVVEGEYLAERAIHALAIFFKIVVWDMILKWLVWGFLYWIVWYAILRFFFYAIWVWGWDKIQWILAIRKYSYLKNVRKAKRRKKREEKEAKKKARQEEKEKQRQERKRILDQQNLKHRPKGERLNMGDDETPGEE